MAAGTGRCSSLPCRWCAAPAAVAVVLAGCSSPGTSLESSPEVTLRSVGALLHNPVWSYRRHTVVALTDDHCKI